MKKKKPYFIGGFVILGIVLGKIFGHLLIYGFWNLLYKHTTNDITEAQIEQYMKNSQSYPMIYDDFIIKEDKFGKSFYPKIVRREQFIFYNSYLKKYFAYNVFDWDIMVEEEFSSIKNIPFQGKVNHYEINSGKGNSVDNPILVWDIDIDSSLLSKGDIPQEAMYKRSVRPHQYQVNTILNYFKYFIPKEEFEKIFPKKE